MNSFISEEQTVRPLKPGEKLTLLCIAESENAERGYAFPSYDYIAQRTNQSVRTVQTHVKTLQENGAFSIEKRRHRRGKWKNSVYIVKVPEIFRANDAEWQRWNNSHGADRASA